MLCLLCSITDEKQCKKHPCNESRLLQKKKLVEHFCKLTPCVENWNTKEDKGSCCGWQKGTSWDEAVLSSEEIGVEQ